MNSKYNELLIDFLKKNKINYKKIQLYKQALTHKTYTNENRTVKSYDLLEFLGDSILQMKSSVRIYKHFKTIDEGNASLIRAKNVSTRALSKLSFNINLNKLLIASNGINELKRNAKVNADIYEALCAAIYLDTGEQELDKFLERTMFKHIDHTNVCDIKDPKSIFQEYTQSYSTKSVVYQMEKLEDGGFKAKLFHNNVLYSSGFGKTKKNAEFDAASKALSKLEKRENEIN